jgi:hypothetical protein
VHGGSGFGVLNITRVDEGLQALALAFAIGLEDTGDFNDPVPLDIEPGGFQIDKDELRHACFRLLGG